MKVINKKASQNELEGGNFIDSDPHRLFPSYLNLITKWFSGKQALNFYAGHLQPSRGKNLLPPATFEVDLNRSTADGQSQDLIRQRFGCYLTKRTHKEIVDNRKSKRRTLPEHLLYKAKLCTLSSSLYLWFAQLSN